MSENEGLRAAVQRWLGRWEDANDEWAPAEMRADMRRVLAASEADRATAGERMTDEQAANFMARVVDRTIVNVMQVEGFGPGTTTLFFDDGTELEFDTYSMSWPFAAEGCTCLCHLDPHVKHMAPCCTPPDNNAKPHQGEAMTHTDANLLAADEAIYEEFRIERAKQIHKGYTPEHDAHHSVRDILYWGGGSLIGRVTRPALVRLGACVVAAIRRIDQP